MNQFYGKKILVAGASGFIGINLVNKLTSLGAKVRGTYHSKTAFPKNLECEYLQVNLENKEDALKATDGVDYIFMCAANTSGAAVIDKKPLLHLTPNLIMNARILEAAYSNSVKKLCFISSNTVYPVMDTPVREDDTNFEFFDKYFIVGWMKLFSEIMCKMYSCAIKEPMDTLIVRPGNIYGPFDKFDKERSKVIAALIRRAVEGEDPFVVWGDGNDIKDFIYIDDFVDGLLKSFCHFGYGAEVNIASGRPISIREIVKMILEIRGGAPVELKFDASKPTMIPKRLIDIEKIVSSTDFEPKIGMREGIEKTMSWYKVYYRYKNPEEFESN